MKRDTRARKARQIRNDLNQEFYDCVRDIMEHPVVLKMKKYPHHCDTNCYQHCVNVSYYNYQICKLLNLDARSAARAGMLHDLFLYDWREHADKTGDRFHGLTHPRAALRRAEKYFDLNDKERDIILKHMWPITVILPKYFESYIICFTDKYCGSCEIADHYSGRVIPKNLRLPFGYRSIYQWASKVAPAVGARAGIGERESSYSVAGMQERASSHSVKPRASKAR